MIVLAAAGGIAFLVMEGDGSGKGKAQHNRKGGAVDRDPPPLDAGDSRDKPLPAILGPAARDPRSAQTQADLAAFVAECRRRGVEAVPLLGALLRDGKDYRLLPRWNFKKRALGDFPTVRCAYLAALRAIPGPEATFSLREALRTSHSWEEAYYIAIGLKDRDVEGWTGDLLDRAIDGTRPAYRHLQEDIIALAAESDPETLAQRLVRDLPRGSQAKTDKLILAFAARRLPIQLALDSVTPLILDEQVNYRARANLITALLSRPEIEVYTRLREEALRTRFDPELSRSIAWAAVNNTQFATDAMAYALATTQSDTKLADEIRRRFEERRRAAGELVNAALNLNLETSNDKRAQALRRALNAHRRKFDGPR